MSHDRWESGAHRHGVRIDRFSERFDRPTLRHRLQHRVKIHVTQAHDAVFEEEAGRVAQFDAFFEFRRADQTPSQQDAGEAQIGSHGLDGVVRGVRGEAEHDDAFCLVHCVSPSGRSACDHLRKVASRQGHAFGRVGQKIGPRLFVRRHPVMLP